MMLITYTLIEYSRLHAMTIMSPSTCSQALSKGISLHAVTFMLREVDLPVMLIVDLSLARVVQHSPFQFHTYAYTVEVISQSSLTSTWSSLRPWPLRKQIWNPPFGAAMSTTCLSCGPMVTAPLKAFLYTSTCKDQVSSSWWRLKQMAPCCS